jgi:hypothetical protein
MTGFSDSNVLESLGFLPRLTEVPVVAMMFAAFYHIDNKGKKALWCVVCDKVSHLSPFDCTVCT